jgi:hypothetical protein
VAGNGGGLAIKYTPLKVACCFANAATEEIIGFLVDGISSLKHDAYFLLPDFSYALRCYAMNCIASEERSYAEFEAIYRPVCDLLPGNDPRLYEDIELLSVAIQKNCKPLIRYFLERAPEPSWSDF